MHRLPQIQILDEQIITEEDRFRAEIYYTETTVILFAKTNILNLSVSFSNHKEL